MLIREIFPLVLNDDSIDTKYLGFTSSTSAKAGMGLIGGYPGTKAGMEMFLRTLDMEKLENVKILAIRAGPVNTNLFKNSVSAPGFDIQVMKNLGERSFLEPSMPKPSKHRSTTDTTPEGSDSRARYSLLSSRDRTFG